MKNAAKNVAVLIARTRKVDSCFNLSNCHIYFINELKAEDRRLTNWITTSKCATNHQFVQISQSSSP